MTNDDDIRELTRSVRDILEMQGMLIGMIKTHNEILRTICERMEIDGPPDMPVPPPTIQ